MNNIFRKKNLKYKPSFKIMQKLVRLGNDRCCERRSLTNLKAILKIFKGWCYERQLLRLGNGRCCENFQRLVL